MSDLYPTILFFGPPGSGKGTQAKFLSDLTGHFHLSAGDVFRSVPKGSAFDQLQRQYSQKGLLLPDRMALKMWRQHLTTLIDEGHYRPRDQLLFADGMPRTAEQAELLQDCLLIKAVINLEVNDENCLISRLKNRALVQGREDDQNSTTLKTRLMVYTAQTKEVLRIYPSEKIATIDANQLPFQVTRDILNRISTYLMYPGDEL